MPKFAELIYSVSIPEEVTATVVDNVVTIKGPKGELTKDFTHADINIWKEGNAIYLQKQFPNKKQAAIIGTIKAHIENMIKGVTKGFEYRLKIVYAHFPIRVSTKGRQVIIENLYGGRSPMAVDIMGEKTKVTVEEEDVVVTGIDIEEVGQTAARIQERCRLRGQRRKSPKTFMDGIYIYKKGIIGQED